MKIYSTTYFKIPCGEIQWKHITHRLVIWYKGKVYVVYQDKNDWWIGYYRGSNYHFICPLPTIVIRWAKND